MKHAAAYYLLFLYAIAFLKPVLPAVTDFFAHTYALSYHIATVHSQKGNHHLHKEISDANADGKQEQKATESKFAESITVHLIADTLNHDYLQLIINHNYNPYAQNLPYPLKHVVVPPPKSCLI